MSTSDGDGPPGPPWPAPPDPIEPIVTTYGVERGEFVWTFRQLRRRSERWAPWHTYAVGSAALAMGLVAGVASGWDWFPIFMIVAGAVVLLLALVEWLLPYWLFRRIPANRAVQRLVVTSATIESGTEEYRVAVPWPSVREIIRDDDLVVLPVLEAHDAFIVPMRVLRDDERARFEQMLERWVAARGAADQR